jgi:hypothetical protein
VRYDYSHILRANCSYKLALILRYETGCLLFYERKHVVRGELERSLFLVETEASFVVSVENHRKQ